MNKRIPLARTPLTKEELKRLTIDDYVRLKLTEDERFLLRQINEERAKERQEHAILLQIEEEPILADLCAVGVNVKSVWSLVNSRIVYLNAIPVLLKHLLYPYSDMTRGGISRSLAVKQARHAWPILKAEFLKLPGSESPAGREAKDGLAVALSVTATDAVIEELIALTKDPKHGPSRILLLSALKKSKLPIAAQALEELANDPQLEKASVFKKHKKQVP